MVEMIERFDGRTQAEQGASPRDTAHPESIVRGHAATASDLQTYRNAERMIQGFVSLPVFNPMQHAGRRILYVLLDGENGTTTALARYERDIQRHRREGFDRVDVVRAEGLDAWPTAIGDPTPAAVTADPHRRPLEPVYDRICERIQTWMSTTTDVEVSIAVLGTGRGATEAAALATLIHARGIHDPGRATWHTGQHRREFDSLSLVPPGGTPLALGLFDPVAGDGERGPRELPASVRGGLQLTAMHRCTSPRWTRSVICPDVNGDDFRSMYFRNLPLAGDHHDLGGGDDGHADREGARGLVQRAGDLMAQYLNTLSGYPLFSTTPPEQRERDVVHGAATSDHAWFCPEAHAAAETRQLHAVNGMSRPMHAMRDATMTTPPTLDGRASLAYPRRALDRLVAQWRRWGREPISATPTSSHPGDERNNLPA